MVEQYKKEVKVKDKSQKEKRKEIILNILKTKQELEEVLKNFEYAEGDLIDYYTYQMKANRAKLDYLIKAAKEQGMQLDRMEQIAIKYNQAM